MFTEWLQPIAETNYIRVLYVGKIQLIPKTRRNGNQVEEYVPTLDEVMKDIWKVAGKYNKEHFISGHLAFANSLHVAQLLEGKEEAVLKLLERIKKDRRIIYVKDYKKQILTVNPGWSTAMCYSFHLTHPELVLLQNPKLSLKRLFKKITETFQIKRSGTELAVFYKKTVDIILLKFISLDQQQLLNVEVLDQQ